jgi:hypothetical protein
MLTRCYNPNDSNFHKYGARGITVCERWRASFHNFFEDMGPRPSPRHSIDRKDNAKGYSPDNCQWATPEEQLRNRRSCVRYEMDGESHILTDWCKRFNADFDLVRNRLKSGWPLKLALTSPVGRRGVRRKPR